MLQKKMFVLNKMLHTSKKSGKTSIKVTYFDIENYIKSEKESQFEGFIPNDAYLQDLTQFNDIQCGNENLFTYCMPDFGTQLKLIKIEPVKVLIDGK